MIKKIITRVRGFSPVELVIMVGFGALAAAALIYLATTPQYMAGTQSTDVNLNIKVDAGRTSGAKADTYGDYITQEGDTLVVSPFDWSTYSGQTYNWYNSDDIETYIVEGGTLPSPTQVDVVNPDGTPNLPENMSLEVINSELSEFYFHVNGDRDLAFGNIFELYMWADDGILGLELKPETIDADLLVLGANYYYELCEECWPNEECIEACIEGCDEGNEECIEACIEGCDKECEIVACDEERDDEDVIDTVYLKDMPEDLEAIKELPARINRYIELLTEQKGVIRDYFTQDSENIQDALSAAIADGGINTVKLAAGNFYLGRAIVAKEFTGNLIGSGPDATFLETVPGGFLSDRDPYIGESDLIGEVGASDINCVYYHLPYAPIYILGGDVRLADLHTDIEGGMFGANIHGDIFNYFMSFVTASGVCNGLPTNEIQEVSLAVDNVVFDADNNGNPNPDFWFHSFVSGPFVHGEQKGDIINRFGFLKADEEPPKLVKGDFHYTNSEFIGGINATWFMGLKDSNVVIGGSPQDGNTFQWSSNGIVIDTDNSAIEVSHNKFAMSGGVDLYTEKGEMTSLVVENNEFDIPEWGWAAVSLVDLKHAKYPDKNGILASISQNKININSEEQIGIMTEFVSDGVMLNNQFTGTGGAGIMLGFGFEVDEEGNEIFDTSGGWTLVGNNMENFQAEWWDGYSIWLGENFKNSVIIGGKNSANVLDLGWGENGHRITGVTSVKASSVPGADTALGKSVQKAHDCRKLLSSDLYEWMDKCHTTPVVSE